MSACRGVRSRVRGLVAVLVLGAGFARGAHAQRGSVAGTVRDSAGHPLALVEVILEGIGAARTDDSGNYRITQATAGSALLTARRLGFAPYGRRLALDGVSDVRADVRLRAQAERLESVAVTAPHEVYDSRLEGFNTRKEKHVGYFVTRERIDRANSSTLSDMLREIPGVHIGPMRNQGRAIRLRGSSCPPLVFVDGFPATAGEFDVDMIDLQSVEGIEIYAGLGSIPPEFTGPRDLDRCGVVAIWSRPFRPRKRATAATGPTRGDSTSVAVATPRIDSVEHMPVVTPTGIVPVQEPLTVDQVDVPARPDSLVPPRYPDSLYASGVRGKVVLEFVVDTGGSVEDGSVDVLSTTHPLFTQSVLVALREMRFRPARVAGQPVRQVVQLPFAFTPPALPTRKDARKPM